ncbi:MAG: hypothetical protein GC192_17125 [Bacteroidetes bacterium]|nr:hypothetical protein [Bacteroidota bacterium]
MEPKIIGSVSLFMSVKQDFLLLAQRLPSQSWFVFRFLRLLRAGQEIAIKSSPNEERFEVQKQAMLKDKGRVNIGISCNDSTCKKNYLIKMPHGQYL